jgi:TolA-binding protein
MTTSTHWKTLTVSSMALLAGLGWAAKRHFAETPGPATTEVNTPPNSRQLEEAWSGSDLTAVVPSPLNSQTANEDVQLVDLAGQLQHLQFTVQRQQRELNQYRSEIARLSQAIETASTQTPDAAQDGSEALQTQEEKDQAYAAKLDAEFTEQPSDGEWNQDAASQITHSVNKVLERLRPEARTGTSLTDAHCRATLCRLEMTYLSKDAADKFSLEFPRELGWNATANYQFVENPDSSILGVIHVSRNGHGLPE